MLINVSYQDRYLYVWGITDKIITIDGQKTIETDLKILKKIAAKCCVSQRLLTKEKELTVYLPTKDGIVDVTGFSKDLESYQVKAFGIYLCGFDAFAPSRIKKEFPKKNLINIHLSNSMTLIHLLMRVATELFDARSYYPKIYKKNSKVYIRWCMHLEEKERFYIQNLVQIMPEVFFIFKPKNMGYFEFVRNMLDDMVQSIISKTQMVDEHALRKMPKDHALIVRHLVKEVSVPFELSEEHLTNDFLEDTLLAIDDKICRDNFPYKAAIIIEDLKNNHQFIQKIGIVDRKKNEPLRTDKDDFKENTYEINILKDDMDSLKNIIEEGKIITIDQMAETLEKLQDIQNKTGIGIILPKGITHVPVHASATIDIETNENQDESLFSPSAIANVRWKFLLGDHSVSLEELQKLADEKKSHYIDGDILIPVNPDQLHTFLKTVKKIQKGQISPFDLLRADVGYGVSYHVSSGWLKRIFDQLKGETPIKDIDQPLDLQAQLRPYQVRGFSWLVFMRKVGLGACLADDMGLGKTIQTISYMLYIRKNQENNKLPFLLVCPTSLLSNWQRELSIFAPSLKVHIHHGIEREKKIPMDNDVIITSYSLVDRDLKVLEGLTFEAVVLDEAQNIKNADTKQTKAVKSLKARHRIILTGTPIENRPTDIWSLMDFLNHGLLGSKGWFNSKYSRALSYSQNEDHQEESQKVATQLKMIVTPFMLRRLKTDSSIIADLPDKINHRIVCTLSLDQTSLYKACVDNMVKKLETIDGMERRGLIFSTLLRLKQICNHPQQFTKTEGGDSGKLDVLHDLIDDILEMDEKVLIFTQFKEMGDILVKDLQKRVGDKILFLNGSTPAKTRGEMVKGFQEDNKHHIFILSLKAGGIGLNLTAANHVIHYDRWWNPAVEDQATSRAHRIGQNKVVSVHTFICEGTIEDRIDMMIQQKIALAGRVVGEGEGWITELNDKELKEILTLKEVA